MQWNNSYFPQDPLDPLFLNDDENTNPGLNLNLNLSLNDYNLDTASSFKAIIDSDLNSSIVAPSAITDNLSSFITSSETDLDNTSPLSSISTNSASLDPLQEEFLSMDNLADYNYSIGTTASNYLNFDQADFSNNNLTINTTELRKFHPSPSAIISNSNSNVASSSVSPFQNGSLQNSPILKSQNFRFSNLNSKVSSVDNSLDTFKLTDLAQVDLEKVSNPGYLIEDKYLIPGRESADGTLIPTAKSKRLDHIVSIPSSSSTSISADNEDDDEEEDEEEEDMEADEESQSKAAANTKAKKISDSRLSLAQLSIVLNLEGNDDETARREKNILKILKEDLNFPIGEKTWIRDTPVDERERLMTELTGKVEQVHGYGYSKKTLSIIVRRASYYMMQGRLRRERRLQRKKKSMSQKKALLESDAFA